MAYPTVLDTFTVPVSGTTLTNNPSFDHAAFHNQLGSAVGTIEHILGTNNGTNLSLGTPSITGGKFDYLNDTAGTHVAVLSVVGAGVNYWQIGGNTTTNPVQAFAVGADSNVGMQFTAKGTGAVQFFGTTIALTGSTVNVITTGGINLLGADVVTSGTFLPGGVWDGWVAANETWTYKSGTQFTVAADVTGKYDVGDKIYCSQGGTIEYFYVTATPAVASGTTTMTILGDSGTPLVNSAITVNYYSKVLTPHGFPNYFAYAGTSSGWNAALTSYGKYRLTGRLCNIVFDVSGTSNDTVAVVSGPVNAIQDFFEVWAYATDNGSNLTTPGNVQIVSGTNTINIWKTSSNTGVWTNTGAKRIIGNLDYIV